MTSAAARKIKPVEAGDGSYGGKVLEAFDRLRCTNSEPGTFNHECGKMATWAGTHRSGHVQHFCDRCRNEGYEARGIAEWRAA